MERPTLALAIAAARSAGHRAVVVAPGAGAVARAAVAAGADALLALSAGVYRAMGLGSVAALMPFANANEQAERLLREHLLAHAGAIALVAGVFGDADDPDVRAYLERLRALGVRSVVYWPSVGHVEGALRAAIEQEGVGLAREISTLDAARALGFETWSFAHRPDDAARLAGSGVDGVVLAAGITRAAEPADKLARLEQAIAAIDAMRASAARARPGLPCLAYGGPITEPEDVERLFRFCDVDGFAGGSVFERLPVADVPGATVRRFKSAAALRADPGGLGDLIGRSKPMLELYDLVRRVAPHDVSVCIEGETGTGKELVATQLHRLSRRARQPFVTLNCGALPETLLESELFGHEKGAFTGADRRRLGKFELADGGTLFLDEVATLSPHGQVALLRALQSREIARVGAESTIAVDVRVIAATNEPLAELVAAGRFRADLYHRLAQLTLRVPPLRERAGDLRLLAEAFLRRYAIEYDRRIAGLKPRFWHKLESHAWPGNVRELQHVLLAATLREDDALLSGDHFAAVATPPSLVASGDAWRAHVRKALRDAGGNKTRAAVALGVTRRTLYQWLAQLDG